MFCAKYRFGILLSAVMACGLGGCAQSPAQVSSGERNRLGEVTTRANAATLVFSGAEVRNWHAQNAAQPGVGIVEADRFEFSRNDQRLSPTSRGPLLATRDWPEPPRPLERRIRFWMWQQ